MKFFGSFAAWLAILLMPRLAHAGGNEVVVVYNSNLPESKMVAEHYAAMRQVPADQIFGFPLTTNEVISRDDFTEQLQKPLAAKLEANHLWRFGVLHIPSTNGIPAHSEERVLASTIRYAALCYGVPLKIAPSSLAEKIVVKITQDELRRNEAAVDSELTWLPVVRMNPQLTGPMPNPFYTVTNLESLNCTNGILLVSRLDGPTAKIANTLVDKAMEAESNGWWGRAYFDARGLTKTDAYFEGDQWMLAGAAVARAAGFDVEVDTNAATLPASYPMSHIAIYAGWYDGNVSGPFTLPTVEFMPGAFAYHLYSFSASSLHGDYDSWCGALLAKGATCTMGCVYEPFMQMTPNVSFFVFGMVNGYTFAEAAWTSQRALSWQITAIGDPLYQPAKNSPLVLQNRLISEKSRLIEWSINRIVNMDLLHGLRLQQVASTLETIPFTSQSAVLTEKLADIYNMLGKPSSAIDAWQRALTLNPSPQQRIRLRRILTEKLLVAGRQADAAQNLQQFIGETPNYPDISKARKALKMLKQEIASAKK